MVRLLALRDVSSLHLWPAAPDLGWPGSTYQGLFSWPLVCGCAAGQAKGPSHKGGSLPCQLHALRKACWHAMVICQGFVPACFVGFCCIIQPLYIDQDST